MKIYFCDLCNESIPQEDLENHRVTTARGKMICAKCVPALAAPAPAAPGAASGGRPWTALLAVLALASGAAGISLAWQVSQRLAAIPDHSTRIDGLRDVCDRLLDGALTSGRQADSLAASVASLQKEPAAIREVLAEHLHRLEGQERALQEVRSLLASLRTDRESVERLELVQGRFEHDLTELKGTLQTLVGRINALGSGPLAGGPGDASGDGGDAVEPALDAETRKLIADLASKDPSTRWSAVDRLAKRQDPAFVPHLLPLLEDADAFVQFRVISSLRELNARAAVGALIQLLRDGDAIVREEALDALVALTGNPLRFNVADGNNSEREKGVKAWEEWFEKNKGRFPEATASS